MLQTQPQSTRSARPGQMTAVMRAVTQQVGPKILRIGVVQGGKVIDERLIKKRDHVTIGPSEKAMFVVPSRKVPPNFRLFEMISGDYYLNFLDGMGGRVALQSGICELGALKSQAKTFSAGDLQVYRTRLTEEARGKVVVAETTFLFQFVQPPPVQPKPQLPVSVQKGFASDIDWFTTIVAAFSFLLHFFFVALVYSDWMDPVVDDEVTVSDLIESVKSLPPPPPAEKPKDDVTTDATAAATGESDVPKPVAKASGGGDTGKGPKDPGKSAAEAKAEADAQASEIAAQLAELNVETLGALSAGGVAQEGVLGSSEVPSGLLDAQGRSSAGAGSGGTSGLNLGGSGSGSVRPGAGGSGQSLKNIGETGGESGDKAAVAGTAKVVKGPTGSAMVGGAAVSGGGVANASSVVAGMSGRFRRCYQRGLDSDPEMAGTANLTARIGPNGEVLGVSGGGGGSIGSIVPCLKAVVQGATFSPPEGGSAQISIPVTFVKQG